MSENKTVYLYVFASSRPIEDTIDVPHKAEKAVDVVITGDDDPKEVGGEVVQAITRSLR